MQSKIGHDWLFPELWKISRKPHVDTKLVPCWGWSLHTWIFFKGFRRKIRQTFGWEKHPKSPRSFSQWISFNPIPGVNSPEAMQCLRSSHFWGPLKGDFLVFGRMIRTKTMQFLAEIHGSKMVPQCWAKATCCHTNPKSVKLNLSEVYASRDQDWSRCVDSSVSFISIVWDPKSHHVPWQESRNQCSRYI